MADGEKGVLHHKIKFNDRVYLVDQIDDLLDAQKRLIDAKQDKIPEGTYQKKLVAGTGIEIQQDGTINCIVTRSQSNLVTVHHTTLDSVDNTGVIDVVDNYHIYRTAVSSIDQPAFKFKNIDKLAGYSVYEIELWVDVMDPTYDIRFEPFSNEKIKYVGDTDYSVGEAGQTVYFAVRFFSGVLFINKYFAG